MKRLLPLYLVLLFATAGVAAQTPPDLQVFADPPRQADRGLPFAFNVLYRNRGGTAATGVTVTVTINNGAPMSQTVGSVGPDEPGRVRFEAIAPDAGDAEIVIRATIRADVDANAANNEDVETIRTFPTFLVTNTYDSGSGSLRTAIDEANASCNVPPGELCKIAFRIPTAGAQWATIRPATPLPALVASRVMIDGTTQTRFADTNPLGPEIEINGSLLTSGNGLTLAAPCGAFVHDLVINGFPDNGIFVGGRECTEDIGSGVDVLFGNYIGTDPTGSRAVPNLRGVFVAPDPRGLVSYTWITDSVISGNRYSGVWVAFGQARVTRSRIGLNAAVTAGLGNGSSGVYIGAGGSGSDIFDNYIGFNGHYGVSMDRATVQVEASRNSYQANGHLAIDHGLDGVSPTLPDIGLTPFVLHAPVLTSARYDAASDTTVVEGTVADARGRTMIVTVYANDEPDPSGFGEGQYFLGHAPVDAEGRFRFTYTGRTPGRWIAAVSTASHLWGLVRTPDSDGGGGSGATTSSEFSRTVEVTQ